MLVTYSPFSWSCSRWAPRWKLPLELIHWWGNSFPSGRVTYHHWICFLSTPESQHQAYSPGSCLGGRQNNGFTAHRLHETVKLLCSWWTIGQLYLHALKRQWRGSKAMDLAKRKPSWLYPRSQQGRCSYFFWLGDLNQGNLFHLVCVSSLRRAGNQADYNELGEQPITSCISHHEIYLISLPPQSKLCLCLKSLSVDLQPTSEPCCTSIHKAKWQVVYMNEKFHLILVFSRTAWRLACTFASWIRSLCLVNSISPPEERQRLISTEL